MRPDTPISPTLLTGNGDSLLDTAVRDIAATEAATTPLPGNLPCPWPLMAHNSKRATEHMFEHHSTEEWDTALSHLTDML
jgi:hypothetical protein